MLFAHGFGCDQNMWRFVAAAFESDYKVVLFDHMGAGRSVLSAYRPAKYDSLAAYASDIVELCTELGLRDVVFVGHSVSAMMGVLAARRAPSLFSRLVHVGPSPRYVNDGDYVGGFERHQIEELLESLDENYLGWSTTMAPVIMGNPGRPELSAELANSFCRTDPAIARNFARVCFLSDNRADLPHVPVHSLVLQCSADVIAPTCVGEYVHRHLPSSEFVQMKATGHCPNLSAPEETIACMRAFLGVAARADELHV
jgi:sigma-B regulation protein RsbQ